MGFKDYLNKLNESNTLGNKPFFGSIGNKYYAIKFSTTKTPEEIVKMNLGKKPESYWKSNSFGKIELMNTQEAIMDTIKKVISRQGLKQFYAEWDKTGSGTEEVDVILWGNRNA
jgi:hypothetical protein